MVPNPDGKSWDVLQLYFKEYYGPTWLYVFDLGTGQVKSQRLPDQFQFYLSGRALGLDGKYYIATPYRRTWNMHLFVYDPATNILEERGEIVPGLGGEVRPLAVGRDGRIYGTGTRGNRVGLYVYDPELRKVVKDFGPIGPSHPNGAWSRYVMGVDDTHAYIASGMIPAWYLVAVNLQTGEEQVLLESPTERVIDIVESFPGAWAIVPQPRGEPRKEYWLYRGQAIEKTGDTPPWEPQDSPWEKGANSKPQVYFDQIDPDADGNATLWYRSQEDAAQAKAVKPASRESAAALPEDLGWKSIHVTGVETYPHRITPMVRLPDGQLYGTGDDYVGIFAFDPQNGRSTVLGPRPGHAPYTHIVCGGKLYSSGYPGGQLFVYDPQRPWTFAKGGPPGRSSPNENHPASNPRRLGEFRDTRVAIMHSSALGADGKIYFGGFGERSYTGGGLGWYDPKTEKLDGVWRPLSGYAVHYITPVLGGRLIAISTSRAPDELNNDQAPEEAKLFLFDVAQARNRARDRSRDEGTDDRVDCRGGAGACARTHLRPGTRRAQHPLRCGRDRRRGALPQNAPFARLDRCLLAALGGPVLRVRALDARPGRIRVDLLAGRARTNRPARRSRSRRGQDRPCRLSDVRRQGRLFVRI